AGAARPAPAASPVSRAPHGRRRAPRRRRRSAGGAITGAHPPRVRARFGARRRSLHSRRRAGRGLGRRCPPQNERDRGPCNRVTVTEVHRMRIALVAEDYYPQLGGVPEQVHTLALQLNSWGHPTTVVASHMGHYADAAFVRRVGTSRVIYSNGGVSRVTTGWRLRRRLEELFRAGRYDIVHVHGGLAPTLGLAAPFAAWRVGIPVVATFHSWFRRSIGCRVFRRPLQRILDRHAATIAVSPPVVDASARYFRAQWDIIPNGVDTTFCRPNGRGRRPPDTLGEHPRLLFLGRIEPRNGLGTLLDAMPRILARFPRAVLTVAGGGGYPAGRPEGVGGHDDRPARRPGAPRGDGACGRRESGRVRLAADRASGARRVRAPAGAERQGGEKARHRSAVRAHAHEDVGDRLDERLTHPPEHPAACARVLVQQAGESARDAQLVEQRPERRVVAGARARRVQLACDDRVRREPAAPRRRTDPLRRHRVRKARRVSDQQHPLARERPGARAY